MRLENLSEKEARSIMITAELTRKINLLPKESYVRVEDFVEQFRVKFYP